MKTVAFIVALGNWFLSAYVFMALWSWFVSPTFDITTLGYAQSLGILLVLSFFKPKLRTNEESDEEAFIFAIALVVLNLLSLGIGAIVHAFI